MATPLSAPQKARVLAEALPFIRAFHACTLIIRFGGSAMADPALKEGFARDVALLRLVGMNPIIVHGGGWRIDELLRAMDIEKREHRGMRIIDEPTLNVIEMALGEINQELVGLVNKFGAKAGASSTRGARCCRPKPAPARRPISVSSATSRASIRTSSIC